jgi:hypothetical protein
MTETGDLIRTEIKGRQVTYFLTTAEDLNNIQSNGIIGDIFAILTSIAIGGLISVLLTKSTDIELRTETLNILDILLYVFITLGLILGLFTVYFYSKTFKTIEIIKDSGVVKSFTNVDGTDGETEKPEETIIKESKLEIIKAMYYTNKKGFDITEELRDMVIEDRLETVASNEIKGDPDPGTVKKLNVTYKYNGLTVVKEFTEQDNIIIP